MSLTLILGPMKSGKSYELISFFAPLSYTKLKFGLYQSARNTRDSFLQSRNGVKLNAKKISSLHDILKDDVEIVGIDEIHMFSANDIEAVEKLLKKGVRVYVSGLDIDYSGKLFDIIARLIELAPQEIKYKRAVCEICQSPTAIYTQIKKNGEAITSGLPSIIPEDGTYTYFPVCRHCFVKNKISTNKPR